MHILMHIPTAKNYYFISSKKNLLEKLRKNKDKSIIEKLKNLSM